MDFDHDPRSAKPTDPRALGRRGEADARNALELPAQRAADASPRVQELTQLQARLDAGSSSGEGFAVVQRASFHDKDGERYNTDKFKDFEALEQLARRWIAEGDDVGLDNLLKALATEINRLPKNLKPWAKANKENIHKLIELIEGRGQEEAPEEVGKGVGVPAPLSFPLKLSVPGAENIVPARFGPFDKKGGVNQADIHFAKHGDELALKNKAEYIKKAQEFGGNQLPDSLEALLGNTYIRVDPADREDRRVFVGNSKKTRTFYKWDPEFSSDPFGYAIYYTITHNMGRPIKDLDPDIAKQLKDFGVDLDAVEEDYVVRALKQEKSRKQISEETSLSIGDIPRVENNYVLRALNQWESPEAISEVTRLSVDKIRELETLAASQGLLSYEPLEEKKEEAL